MTGPFASDLEIRFQVDAVSAANDAASMKLGGYAAVFATRATIRYPGGEFSEVIERGAFAASLRSGGDVRLLLEHDALSLLARTTAGTLVLAEDDRGLRFDAQVVNTSTGRDAMEQVRARNITGCSFGFVADKYTVERDASGAVTAVTHHSVILREITLTSLPAYPQTSVALRSALSPQSPPPPDTRALRLRLARLRVSL